MRRDLSDEALFRRSLRASQARRAVAAALADPRSADPELRNLAPWMTTAPLLEP